MSKTVKNIKKTNNILILALQSVNITIGKNGVLEFLLFLCFLNILRRIFFVNNSAQQTDARKRIAALFDDGTFTEIDAFAKSANGEIEVVAGFGSVAGTCAYAFSQDVTVDSGAISVAQCAKIKKIYDLASKTGYPVIGIYDSNGVKLTEGFEAINAYGEILKASTAVSGVVPQVSIIAGACLGTSALMANMADVVIAVKDADFYVCAPSDLTASESYEDGNVDILADDVDSAILSAKKVISLLPSNNLSSAPYFDFAEPCACNNGMSGKEIVNAIADANSVLEIKAGYGSNVTTALSTVAGSTVGFVAFDGQAICPACAYKAESFVKLCDAFNVPIVTIANADGLNSEKQSQMLTAATKLTSAFASTTCPKISLVTSQAIGSAYIILAGKGANADLSFAWDNAVVSPLDVDASVAFLFNDRLANGEDREALKAEYKETIGSPFSAGACGAIDDVFAAELTRSKIIAGLQMLDSKRETTIPRKHSVK